jgi:hypothetical protein
MCHLKVLNCEGKVSGWSGSYQAKGRLGNGQAPDPVCVRCSVRML